MGAAARRVAPLLAPLACAGGAAALGGGYGVGLAAVGYSLGGPAAARGAALLSTLALLCALHAQAAAPALLPSLGW